MDLRSILLCIVLAAVSFADMAAQNVKSSVTGMVTEEENGQAVVQAGVQLLSARDSSLVEGVVTDIDGRFSIPCLPGDYILKVSCVGLVTAYRDLHQSLSKNDLDLGVIPLAADAIFLESAVVAAKAPPVTVIEDTVVYNAAAFRVAEDATLGELLKKIPGLEINGSKVTLHGKEVRQLLVGGRKFFGGDVKAGLKNISADMVENIRAYEKESDMARLTGVDDGEEEPVLDITMKRGAMNNWRNRVVLGGGTEDRYMGRANATRVTRKEQYSVIANVHNTNEQDLSKATATNITGNGNRGETVQNEAGFTFSKVNNKMEMGGSLLFNGSDRDAMADARQQTIYSSSVTYNNSNSHYRNIKDTFKTDLEFEWHLPNNFTVIFKPVFSYNGTNDFTDANGTQFKTDPYEVEGYDPADYVGLAPDDDPYKRIRVNSTRNVNQGITSKITGNVSLQVSKALQSKKGRNISLRMNYIFDRNVEDRTYDYMTRYYKIKKKPDSTRLRKQYLDVINPSATYTAQISYSEPLMKKVYLQGVYIFTYKDISNDKDFYSLQNDYPDWTVQRRSNAAQMKSALPDGYQSSFDPLFSSVGYYNYFCHKINVNLRYLAKQFNISGGINVMPQNTILHYDDGEGMKTVRTSVVNVSPQIMVRLRKKKTRSLTFTYRGSGGTPSMYNLMPVTNGTSATNVFQGNPYLKPSFTQNVNLSFNNSNIKKQESFVTNFNFNTTKNAASNCTEYDPDSGVRTSHPENIDGNWKVSGNLSYNKTFRDNRFSMSNHTRGDYRNNMAYLYNNKLKVAEVNRTTRAMIRESADLTFRNDWLELLLEAGADYTKETSLLRPDMNQTPWSWNGGASVDITFPWKMRFTTDFNVISQKGYSYEELNRDYYMLNARLTQPFFKSRFIVRLDWYDILDQAQNVVRSFNSERRSVTLYNGVNSYIMLRLVYKFKV